MGFSFCPAKYGAVLSAPGYEMSSESLTISAIFPQWLDYSIYFLFLKKESSKEIQGPAKYAVCNPRTPLRRAVGTPNESAMLQAQAHASC